MAAVVTDELTGVEFGLLGRAEVVRSSVQEITSPNLYTLGIPVDNGLNSLKLGTSDSRIRCSTCRHSVHSCPGHPGHLHLAAPMYHVAFLDTTIKVLRCVCTWCSAVLAPPARAPKAKRKALQALALAGRAVAKCPACGGPQPTYARLGATVERTWADDTVFESEAEKERAHAPFDARAAHRILEHISDDGIAMLGMSPDYSRPADLILTELLVPSVVIRPSVQVDDGSRTRGQDDLTLKLNDVVKANAQLKEALEKKSPPSEVARLVDAIQLHISLYLDKDNTTPQQQQERRRQTTRSGPCRSLASRMRGKKGRIRGNLMGIFLLVTLMRLPSYAFMGMITEERMLSALAVFPAVAVGALLGDRIHLNLKESTFQRLVAAALTVIGVLLLAR